MSVPAVTEDGGSAVAQKSTGATASSTRASLGVRAMGSVKGPITPRVELRYMRELPRPFVGLPAAFVDAPTQTFTLESGIVGRNALAASAGATIAAFSKLVLSAEYHATLASGDRRHLLALGLAF